MNTELGMIRFMGILAILFAIAQFFYMLYRQKVKGYLDGYKDAKEKKSPKYTPENL